MAGSFRAPIATQICLLQVKMSIPLPLFAALAPIAHTTLGLEYPVDYIARGVFRLIGKL